MIAFAKCYLSYVKCSSNFCNSRGWNDILRNISRWEICDDYILELYPKISELLISFFSRYFNIIIFVCYSKKLIKMYHILLLRDFFYYFAIDSSLIQSSSEFIHDRFNRCSNFFFLIKSWNNSTTGMGKEKKFDKILTQSNLNGKRNWQQLNHKSKEM